LCWQDRTLMLVSAGSHIPSCLCWQDLTSRRACVGKISQHGPSCLCWQNLNLTAQCCSCFRISTPVLCMLVLAGSHSRVVCWQDLTARCCSCLCHSPMLLMLALPGSHRATLLMFASQRFVAYAWVVVRISQHHGVNGDANGCFQ
jgi:hypothetical protein